MTNKDMNKIFSISALAAGMLALASCNDVEPKTPQEDDNDPNAINFSIGQSEASSRTQYSTADDLQIEWVKDDKITIWATPAQGSPTSADYVVSQVIASTKTIDGKEVTTNSKAKIAPTGTALKWSGDVQHTFCGIYGEKVLSFSLSDGQAAARLQYPLTQTLEKVNGSWVNMKQAYMVAYATCNQKSESVNLNFQPIMTTLDVVVKGMAAGTGAEPIKVKSLSVETVADADVLDGEEGNEYLGIKFSPSNAPSASRYTITTDPPTLGAKRTITFELATPQEVAVDGSLSITAILPSIEISENKPVTITVTTDDGSKSFKFSGPVTAGNKAKIVTKPWGTQQSTVPEGAVDMGLKVYWAESVLKPSDASSRADAYSYYGWGCTKPYSGTFNDAWTKYFRTLGLPKGTSGYTYMCCGSDDDPLKDFVKADVPQSISGSKFDAAQAILGDKWRMPTNADWEELLNNCTWEWQGTGYKVTSNIDGYKDKYIFLPAGGMYSGNGPDGVDNTGYYWSASPIQKDPTNERAIYENASFLGFNSGTHVLYNYYYNGLGLRCKGLMILPVAAK